MNYCYNAAVYNKWNGMVEWNTGMEYWNDPKFQTVQIL